jgi:hypothetical protein
LRDPQNVSNHPRFLRHRDASQHACPVAEPVPAPKNEVAHALLAKHFPSVATGSSNKPVDGPSRKVPTDPKKLVQFQKVELMKMRHRAVPADPKDKPGSIGIDQRLHVKVRCKGDREMVEKIFWFRKVAFVPPCSLSLFSIYSRLPGVDCGYRESNRYTCSSVQHPDQCGRLANTTVSALLFTALQPLRLSRRETTSQEELVVLETDRLLREQVEDGCELFLNSNNGLA